MKRVSSRWYRTKGKVVDMDSFFAGHPEYHKLTHAASRETVTTFDELFVHFIAPLYNSNIVIKDFIESVQPRISKMPPDGIDIRRSLTTRCRDGAGKISFLLRLQARVRRLHFLLFRVPLSQTTTWLFEYMEVGVSALMSPDELRAEANQMVRFQRSPVHFPEEEQSDDEDTNAIADDASTK